MNVNNGERFATYVISGKAEKRDFCLNGAAARKAQIGDKIIIIAYAHMSPEEAAKHHPTVIQMGEGNEVI